MNVLLHNLSVCEYKTYSKREKLHGDAGTLTNIVYFRRVLPSCVNMLGYLRLRQTTTLSQHTSVVRKLASRTPQKINYL